MKSPCRVYRGPAAGGTAPDWLYGKAPTSLRKATGERYLHRAISAAVDGPIPKGVVVMHTCDTPMCFLYEHLRRGTQGDNMRDAVAKGRHNTATMRRHGEDNPFAKVTNEQADEIRRRYVRGTGPNNRGNSAALAAEFGISASGLRKILRRSNP